MPIRSARAGNPVRAFQPDGQRAYLRRLVCPGGAPPDFRRIGNIGPGPYSTILDDYEVKCGDVVHRVDHRHVSSRVFRMPRRSRLFDSRLLPQLIGVASVFRWRSARCAIRAAAFQIERLANCWASTSVIAIISLTFGDLYAII